MAGFASGSNTEQLGSTPKAVLASYGNNISFVTEGQGNTYLKIVEGGFYHVSYFDSCSYVAFL